ncbi:MAG: TonB-dependent receptor [Bacteroidota bacterium]|nr:TonB-dependent receptor [Bacteroidota bacterium]MDP4225253.1 TonB-dependent receptor [Bacteroidota bacterium]MDP4272952.1 TonB-dependent receptor [Bacteroidota bacterium]
MSAFKHILLIVVLAVFRVNVGYGQHTALIFGTITDINHQPLSSVTVKIEGEIAGTTTDRNGSFRLLVPDLRPVIVVFSCVGYRTEKLKLFLNPNSRLMLNFSLSVAEKTLDEVLISGHNDPAGNWVRVGTKSFDLIPNPSGNIEELLKTMPGVASNNELSSQYSVRGGNFDENLVYVNDVEVYRPYLVHSGQQEGLSFVNSDMVSSVKFSAGGFDASYGDKMSSVLDVNYKRPTAFGGSVLAGLLGGAVHLEGLTKNNRLSYNIGLRYKSNQYLLNSLPVQGDYKPSFSDFQTFLTYRFSRSFNLEFLGNYSGNTYHFIPQSRNTTFGTYLNPLNLKMYYDGQEIDNYNLAMGALTANYHPDKRIFLKFILSANSSNEKESYDVQAQYWLNELDNTSGSITYGDSTMNLGMGSFLTHARNRFNLHFLSFSQLGSFGRSGNMIKWGFRCQSERVNDKMNEWEMVDSAGYSLPYDGNLLVLERSVKADNTYHTIRTSGYVLHNLWLKVGDAKIVTNIGLRASYWDFNHEFLLSPRAAISIVPKWERQVLFRFSSGCYFQPPYYRELRNRNGEVNYNIKAQRSVHFLAGCDYYLKINERPFILTAEAYYKKLSMLIPYTTDNLRTEYSALNNATGYTTGLDLRLYGEFVEGVESWASLSLMRSMEDIKGDYYMDATGHKVDIGSYPRPTDQLLNLSMFFQDYLPDNPSFKVFLTLFFGSPLPSTNPTSDRYDQIFRMPSYKRVDIGFSKMVTDENSRNKGITLFKAIKSIWLSAEIFNLLGVNNTVSNMWIKAVSNQQGISGEYAVPNYLTSRRLNLKVQIKF